MKFEIEMENGKIMKGELYPDIAPITVDNFVNLIENHFYDELIFHRVIAGFMILRVHSSLSCIKMLLI